MTQRYALLDSPDSGQLDRYMPANYEVTRLDDAVVISGEDVAGWTLDGYVLPRLASGLHFAHEIDGDEAARLLAGEPEGEDL